MKLNSYSSKVKNGKATNSTRLNFYTMSNSNEFFPPITQSITNKKSPLKTRKPENCKLNLESKISDRDYFNEFKTSPRKKILTPQNNKYLKLNNEINKTHQATTSFENNRGKINFDKIYKSPIVSKDSNHFFNLFGANETNHKNIGDNSKLNFQENNIKNLKSQVKESTITNWNKNFENNKEISRAKSKLVKNIIETNIVPLVLNSKKLKGGNKSHKLQSIESIIDQKLMLYINNALLFKSNEVKFSHKLEVANLKLKYSYVKNLNLLYKNYKFNQGKKIKFSFISEFKKNYALKKMNNKILSNSENEDKTYKKK